jgi:hypothetical protein
LERFLKTLVGGQKFTPAVNLFMTTNVPLKTPSQLRDARTHMHRLAQIVLPELDFGDQMDPVLAPILANNATLRNVVIPAGPGNPIDVEGLSDGEPPVHMLVEEQEYIYRED